MRWLQLARRELWQRRLPKGLVGWGYLWPGGDDRLRCHRQIWWQRGDRWPRGLWLMVQGWQWLRWVLWYGWLSTGYAVHRRGPAVMRQEGISLAQQWWRVGRLALGWCILPSDAYRFGLYRCPAQALDYIYEQELPAYHYWRSAPLGLTQTSLDLLQDKLALAEALTPLGIPMVPTAQCVTKNAPHLPLTEYLREQKRVFCKSRSTHQGRGAFAAWHTATGLAGQRFEGEPLADTAAVEAAWQHLCTLDDALIQPCLTNHRVLAPLAFDNLAITVRYISQWQGAEPCGLSAVLEVPTGLDQASHRTLYTILPIDLASGQLLPWPYPENLPEIARQAMDRLWGQLPANLYLPDWASLVAASHCAQRQFPDVWAIAWDWVLTPDGPVLLEGNSGWGMATPQMLQGGILQMVSPNCGRSFPGLP